MSDRDRRGSASDIRSTRKAELSDSEALNSGLRKLDQALESLEERDDTVEAAGRTHDDDADSGTSPTVPAGESWGGLQILRKIGEGGFGQVFVAHDSALDRDVALKLRSFDRRTQADTVRRFLEEARRLARVNHPNVVVVHGADVNDQQVGIWMDLIQGKNLEEVVSTLGPLGPGEVVTVGRDLCRALAAVHEAGLLHGDLKPSNVMREEGGRILLMDFGACLNVQSSDDDQVQCYGTAVNAAPEVLAGQPADSSSDIYSLGVLLFFLLTGRYPVEGQSLEEVRTRHESQDRSSLTDLRPELPSGLVNVVERCLSSDPHRRFSSVGAVESALSATWDEVAPASPAEGKQPPRWLAPALVGAMAVLAVAALWWGRGGGAAAGGVAGIAEEMVAIAPLVTDGDQESELLALAVSDYLTTRLREAGLPVLAPNEVERIVASRVPLDVHAGTAAGQVVTGEVLAATTGGSKVALSVDRFVDGGQESEQVPPRRLSLPLIPNDFAHFHNTRQALAEDVVLALAVDADLPPDSGIAPAAPDAYRLALSADRLMRSTLCDDNEGLESLLREALARDPESAYYWWLLGNHYFTRVWGCGDPIALLDKAFSAAARADRLSPQGDSAQAQLRHTYLLESSRTEDSYALALAHARSGVDGLYRVALTLRYAGFLDLAEERLTQILDEDPIYFYRGNYGRAPNTLLYLGDLERFLEQIPTTGPYHSYYAGFVNMLQGDAEGAREVLSDAFEAFPSDMFSSLSRALFAVLSDQPDLARVTIRQLASGQDEPAPQGR